MKKSIFKKIGGLFLGLAMGLGVAVGVTAGNKGASPVDAADTELTFSLTSNPGGWPTSSSAGNYDYTLSDTKYTFALGTNVYFNSTYLMLKYTTSLGLPAISGKKLTKIVASNSSGCSTSTRVGVSSSSSSASYISGGSYQTWSTTSSTYTYNLTSTSANTMYYLYITNKNCQITQIKLTYSDVAVKTLSSISLNTSNVQTAFTTGAAFNSTGLVTTAHYTDSTSFPDETVTPTSIESPDMSTAGDKTVTVSYTYSNVTKYATYPITVSDPKTVSSFEFLGDISSGDIITETAEEVDFSIVGTTVFYLLKFSDNSYGAAVLSWSNSDGLSNVDHYTNEQTGDDDGGYIEPTFTKNGIFTLTLSYGSETPLTITWKVKGFPNVEYVDDTLTPTNISNPSSYSDWSGKTKSITGINSEASYAGYSTGGTSKIQMRKDDSGIYSAVSGGKISKVTIAWNSSTTADRDVVIYASNTAFDSVDDILDGTEIASLNSINKDTEYTFTADYAYVGIRAYGGALYLDSVTFTWAVVGASTDTLKSVEITGDLSKTTYYAGQTVVTKGLTVIATFEDDEEQEYTIDVTADATWDISYPTALAQDEGTSKSVTFEASYSSGGTTETDSVSKAISIAADSVTKLSWETRGTIDVFAGTTLGDAVDTKKWTFAPTWASGKEDSPSWGTGANDVHVGLYSTPTPTSESETKLTSSSILQASDNGMYIVACYQGKFSGSNETISVTKWRSVTEVITGHGTYNFSSVTGTSEITNTTTFNGYFSSTDGLTAPTVTLTKVYQANGAVRLATGSASGSIVFNFGSKTVSAVTIVAHGWSDSESKCTMSITNGGTVQTTNNSTNDTFNVELSAAVSSVTFSSAKNNRICIESITFASSGSQEIGKSSDCLGLEEYIATYLHMSDYTESQGWCKDVGHNYYGKNTETGAKYYFNQLNLHQRTLLSSNSAYTEEWARLNAWAAANGESLNGSILLAARPGVSPLLNIIGENTNTVATIVIICIVSITAIGGYFFYRKRKEI